MINRKHKPDGIEYEKELDEDASEWQDASDHDARPWLGEEGEIRDTTRNLIGLNRIDDRLK